jgi:type IV pilus assembly protein PilF
MRHEFLRLVCAALLCGALAACATTGSGPHVFDSKTDKKEDAARVRVELGQRYMQQGKLELALDNLQKALQYDANFVDAHTVIAVLYEHIGNLKAAEEHYARAAELAPKSGDANNNYGRFLCAQGKYDQAQTYFARAMEDPFYKYPDVLYTNAGTCLVDHGGEARLDQAGQDLHRALEANPNNSLALFYMAKVLYLKNDFFHARAFIQRFEALGKPDPAALLLARNIEVKLDHADTARDYAQRLHQDFPDSAQTRSLDSVAPASH